MLRHEAAAATAPFHLIEATIDDIHAALASGRLSCRGLLQLYLDRIAAYDRAGPALTAVQSLNPEALRDAAALDARLAAGEMPRRLFGIPVVVKDQINSSFAATSYGSALFRHFVPRQDATVIQRLRAAGAIVLAKTTMGEFATAYSGSAFGDCRNAYDPRRSPSGSSCGSGVAVAANFAMLGIGEDTGGSVRGPCAHGSLVGLRPTLPLVSRAGMMPYAPSRDTIGPMARTVRDAARLLEAIAGYDPADPVTAESYGNIPDSYSGLLATDGLQGLRFGLVPHPMEKADVAAPDYAETQAAVAAAAEAMRRAGASVIEGATVPGFRALFDAAGNGDTYEVEAAIDGFLAAQAEPPVRRLQEIVASPLVIERRRRELRKALGRSTDEIGYLREELARRELRLRWLKLMADERLDGLVYATYDHAPAPIPVSTPGSNRRLASILAWPAITMPAGFYRDGLPIGLELLGRPFSEPLLLRAAYAFEQATHWRRPPPTTPPLAGEP